MSIRSWASLVLLAALSVASACTKETPPPSAPAPSNAQAPSAQPSAQPATPNAAAVFNAQAKAEAPPGATDSGSFGWKDLEPAHAISLKAQLEQEAKIATALHRKPIAYLHAAWCPPCKAIDKFHDDPRMQDAFAGTQILRIDVDQFTEKDFMEAHLVTSSIPKFFPLDANGVPTGRNVGGSAWDEDIPENMAPVLKKFFAESN